MQIATADRGRHSGSLGPGRRQEAGKLSGLRELHGGHSAGPTTAASARTRWYGGPTTIQRPAPPAPSALAVVHNGIIEGTSTPAAREVEACGRELSPDTDTEVSLRLDIGSPSAVRVGLTLCGSRRDPEVAVRAVTARLGAPSPLLAVSDLAPAAIVAPATSQPLVWRLGE